MNSEMLIKFADFYGISIDYLIGLDDTPSHDDENDDLAEILQVLRDREDLRALLHVSKKNTPEQVRRLTKLIESIKEG